MSVLEPGTSWVKATELQPTTNKLHAAITQVLASANFSHLQNVAIQSRSSKSAEFDAATSCIVDTETFTFGMNNLVLKITFSDGVVWIARVSLPAGTHDDDVEEATTSLLSEVATLRTLRARTTIPVPDVFAFNASKENELGFPYILMEYLQGHTLRSIAARNVPPEHRSHVARQLAEVLFQLQNLSFSKLGRLWCGKDCNEPPSVIPFAESDAGPIPATSLEWFYHDRQRQNRTVIASHAKDPEWQTACWILKTAIAHIIVEDRTHGPFPLCHFDLHYGNLLFDDDYNLTGVLDWSSAGTAPLERLAVSPEFITFPGIADQENQLIIDFRNAVREDLRVLEPQSSQSSLSADPRTKLSAILGTRRAEIIHRCTYSFPHRALWDGRLVAELIYKNAVSWEQLVATYGHCTLY